MCNYSWDDKVCTKRGSHYCEPRADRAVGFFAEVLVHTKGTWARQAFILDPWQEDEIVRPGFGEVIWSADWKRYVRRYSIVIIVVGRKNGKSEVGAGVALELLIADDEEGAEVYGAAKDTKQAGKVAQVAVRMRELSPLLSGRLGYNKNERRIYDPELGSYYEVITADALGELGHNPHGFVLDEVLSQPDGALWDSMRTASGARTQPMMWLLTTETNDPMSFGAQMIDEAERVWENPKRAPHILAYVRKLPANEDQLERLRARFAGHPDLPVSCDVFDERNWKWPNPALGSFQSIESLRKDALDAKNDPTKENAFRQFRCNQRVQQVTRHMPLHVWDECGRQLLSEIEEHARGRAFGGLDLASAIDLAALTLLLPGEGTEESPHRLLWKFWTPETQVPVLDHHTDGQFSQWVRSGLVTVTEGDWIEFARIRSDLDGLLKQLDVVHLFYDPAMAPDTAQWLRDEKGVEAEPHLQGYRLSAAMNELKRLAKVKGIEHGGNPVARWNADCVEVMYPRDDPDLIKPVKPRREASSKRIDGYVSAAMCVSSYMQHGTRENIAPASAVPTAVGENVFRPSGRLLI